jgi:opacity protein-like surface antigen
MDNKFNKNFEDLAWSEMQKLLDRDLPVAEKKRRAFVFWLFLMGGLMLISGGIYSQLINKKEVVNNTAINYELNNKKEVVINAELNNKIELNTQKEVIINSKLNNKTELNIQKEIANNTAIKAELNTPKEAISPFKTAIKGNREGRPYNDLKPTIKVALAPELNNKTALKTDINIASEINNTALQPSNPKLETNEGTPQYKTENEAILKENLTGNYNKNELSPLETLEPQSLTTFDSVFFKEAIKPLYWIIVPIRCVGGPTFKSTKTHFGVTAGIHTEGSSKIDGGQFGLVANRFLRRNWGLNVGLNYRKTSVNVDSSSNLNLGYAFGTTTTTNVYPQNALIPVKRILLKELNYLELPISLNYHFNRKLSISTGIKMAYLIVPKVAISADSTVFFLNDISKKSSINDPVAFNSVKALGLNRWDFAAIGGLNYNLTDKIQLSLRYDYGFKNVLNRANWSAYNRFIGFNAAYYFK